jgi:transposase
MPHIQAPTREQLGLPNLEEFIKKDNVVRVIDAFVDSLDLQAMGFERVIAKREGRPCFHPSLMLKLYLYGYLNGIRSSRKLERECKRNLELHWLLQGLFPAYHTISDFRKDHPLPLTSLFATFTHFLHAQHMLGADTVGIDGSKFRAVNSKKNNYNEKKIKRHLGFIEKKGEQYLKELQEYDLQELSPQDAAHDKSLEALQVNKQQVQAKLVGLAKRKEKYLLLGEKVKASVDGQVSTTDADSRPLAIRRKIVEIAYNLQTAVDSKYKLIVYCKATNLNDAKALYAIAQAAKNILDIATLTVLADKGYHNGEQLKSCQRDSISTLVAYRNFVERGQGPTVEYYLDKFIYSKQNDSYTCPQGHLLKSNGNWYKRSGGKGHQYTFKRYLTMACQSCAVKDLCSKRTYGRNIDRTEYQDAVEENNHRVDTQKEAYLQRQAICEHPFGTIKRAWGYSYTLLKGLKKVNGEMSLICTVYNLRRSLTILGIEKLMALLKEKKLQTIAPMIRYLRLYRSFLINIYFL